MARRSKTGGNAKKAKVRKPILAKGRKTAKTKRIAPAGSRGRPRTISDLSKDLKEAREQQAATAQILKVIARSPDDVQQVFEAIASSANRLLGGFSSTVFLFSNGMAHLKAFTPTTPEADQILTSAFPSPIANVAPFQMTEAGEAVQISDTQAPTYQLREIARARGYGSMLFAPLMNKGTSVGFIAVTRVRAGTFSDHHVQLLQTFADQAVIAIENARVFDELNQRTEDLSESLQQQTATADVLKVISRSAFDLQAVLDALLASACRLCKADFGTIRYEENGDYRLAAAFGCKPEWIEHFAKYSTRPDRNSVFGRTIVEGRAVHIPDVLADPEFKRPEAQKLINFRTALGVPLVREGQPFGVINLFRFEVGSFNEMQIELVSTFADQAVIAIENARLFDEVQAKTRDLTEALRYQTGSANILKVIASSPTDVEPVLQAIVESACELCEAYDAVVLLKDRDDLRFTAHHGPIPINLDKWPINPRWTAGLSVLERKAVHVRDMLSDEGAIFPDSKQLSRRTGTSGIRSILAVPLLRENESIGSILLRRTEVQPFSEKQIALLQSFADQAVIALGNVRLFEDVQARTRELSESLEQQMATSEVLETISAAAGELEPVFQKMLENASRVCGASFGTLNLFDKERFETVALYNVPPAFAASRKGRKITPHPEAGLSYVTRTKQTAHIHDLRQSPAYLDGTPAIVEFVEIGGARTVLIVPMLKESELVRTITIYRKEVRPFTAKQIDLVSNFAKQAVIAIENTRLLKELRERTNDLSTSLEELRTAQDRLIQTEKLASLGQLTAGIAHEIKNPLNFINNFSAVSAELIEEMNGVLAGAQLEKRNQDQLDELAHMLKGNLEKIVQHGKRADSIVKNMLLHSREGSGERRLADINAIVEESLNLAYHGARAENSGFNITIRRDLDQETGVIDLHPQEITRVLLNLISNGFYAATKRKEGDEDGFEPTLTASTKSLANGVEIRIRDNGTGIPEEIKAKIFNPFFTTKPAGQGTGLGLSMSHDIIVKQHGGTIRVDTEAGVFTEFIVTLPRATSAQKPERSA
jgi:two-component system, NtrC family, sensor kinase